MKDLVRIIYPGRCSICDDIVEDTGGICSSCRKYISYVSEPLCKKCGKEIDDAEEEYCTDCVRIKKSFVRGFPVFNYISPVKESLSRLKYEMRQEYACFYGKEIAERFCKEFKDAAIDVLVPVPVSKKRFKKRGYNQAELIAAELGKCIGVQVNSRMLQRSIDTLPQKKLGNEERMRNLMKAFSVNPSVKVPGRILLVDDIYTTGSTIEACSRALIRAGAEEVYFTSAAIGRSS